MKCILADYKLEMRAEVDNWGAYLEKYKVNFDTPDFIFQIMENDIIKEHHLSDDENLNLGSLRYTAVYRKLAEIIPLKNGFVLHSATIDIGGVGVAFAAHSGTGKTTHMNLWQKLLGDKMVIVNGDKPIVRFFDDEPETPYAYGTPWCGKEQLGCNMRTKLQHICFIERSEKNFVEPMEKADAIERIFNQVYKPSDPVAVMKTMQLIDRLLSCCKLWTIHCNMEDEAAEVAYNTIIRNS